MSLIHPPKGTLGLAALDDDTVDWFKEQHSASNDTKFGPNEEKEEFKEQTKKIN